MNDLVWRLLIDAPQSGPRNMAVDEALLRVADEKPDAVRPILRFYQWCPSAISIGYGQQAEQFDSESYKEKGYGFVRRLTGGGAIFHYRELTFSFVAPVFAFGGTPDTDKVYSFLNLGLVEGLRLLGADVQQRGCGDASRNESATFCTVRTSPYDIVSSGRKLLGSAQRWTKRVVLEHGFLPIENNPLTPEVLSMRHLLGREVDFTEMMESMCKGFRFECGVELEAGTLSSEEAKQADEFTLKYESDEWSFRR